MKNSRAFARVIQRLAPAAGLNTGVKIRRSLIQLLCVARGIRFSHNKKISVGPKVQSDKRLPIGVSMFIQQQYQIRRCQFNTLVGQTTPTDWALGFF